MPCARLRLPFCQHLSARKYIVSYRIMNVFKWMLIVLIQLSNIYVTYAVIVIIRKNRNDIFISIMWLRTYFGGNF